MQLSGRGRFDPALGQTVPVQEFDYSVTPTTYTYTAADNIEQFERFPLVNSRMLAQRAQRPRKVRMLARDFIDDSLYNPTYGYFSESAQIYGSNVPAEQQTGGNIDNFLDAWTKEYERAAQGSANERAARGRPAATEAASPGARLPGRLVSGAQAQAQAAPGLSEAKAKQRLRQVWHTPSELFHPHYGRTLARYMVQQHRAAGNDHLVIYEVGAGNGTLMTDILDYLRTTEPSVYAKTEYNVIEISPRLAVQQKATSREHGARIKIVNKSVFEWTQREDRPCFFIALEVWDNLSHDVIRYDNTTDAPHQGYVVAEPDGNFTQVFSDKLDSWAARLLAARTAIGGFKPDWRLGWHPLTRPRPARQLKNAILPFNGNLSSEEYIPTRFFELLHVLRDSFPQHHLIGSDFTHFTERIAGYNSPVVQTFMEGSPVPISTFMAIQGYFDIMFPTDFRFAAQLYEHVCGRRARVAQHGKFLREHVDPADPATQGSENPMLSFYRNAAFLTTAPASATL